MHQGATIETLCLFLDDFTEIGPMCMTSVIYPFVPHIDPSNASDTQNCDDTFLDMEPIISDEMTRARTRSGSGRMQIWIRQIARATPSRSRSSWPTCLMTPWACLTEIRSKVVTPSSLIMRNLKACPNKRRKKTKRTLLGPVYWLTYGEAASAAVVLGHVEPISELKTAEARPTALPLYTTLPNGALCPARTSSCWYNCQTFFIHRCYSTCE